MFTLKHKPNCCDTSLSLTLFILPIHVTNQNTAVEFGISDKQVQHLCKLSNKLWEMSRWALKSYFPKEEEELHLWLLGLRQHSYVITCGSLQKTNLNTSVSCLPTLCAITDWPSDKNKLNYAKSFLLTSVTKLHHSNAMINLKLPLARSAKWTRLPCISIFLVVLACMTDGSWMLNTKWRSLLM